MQRAGHFHQRTQLDQITRPTRLASGGRGGSKLLQQPLNVLLFGGKRKLVGIAHTEFDAIRIAQEMARDLPPVDPSAVPAVQVLDRIGAVLEEDAAVVPRGAVVAQH